VNESLGRITGWIKAHPALAVGILLVLGVVGYYLYKHGVGSSSGASSTVSSDTGTTSGGAGAALSTLPTTSSFTTTTYTTTPKKTQTQTQTQDQSSSSSSSSTQQAGVLPPNWANTENAMLNSQFGANTLANQNNPYVVVSQANPQGSTPASQLTTVENQYGGVSYQNNALPSPSPSPAAQSYIITKHAGGGGA
jgi:hypothetical protein